MSISDQLPRVLLLSSESPHTGAAGAIVLHRLLREYPADRLLVVTSRLPPEASLRLECRYEHLPLAADRLNRTRFWPWRSTLRALGGSSMVSLSRVDAALGAYEPEVVVTLMQDSWYYDLAGRYAAEKKLPLVLLAHDVAHGFEPVPRWLHKRQLHRDARVYRQATARLCISEGMASYHQAIFGVPGEVLLPPRSSELTVQSPESCRGLKRPGRLTLGYAGGLHYGYGEQILKMLPLLRETATVVELFGPAPGGSLASLRDATDVLHFNGYAPTPEAALRSLLEKCDALVQPYLDPAAAHELQYRTHFPSKLGDCLSLGLPLLITGPDFASGVAWCRQRPGIALWVEGPGNEAMREALRRLRTDPEMRVSLASSAMSAGAEFAPAALREKLLQVIVRAKAGDSSAVSREAVQE